MIWGAIIIGCQLLFVANEYRRDLLNWLHSDDEETDYEVVDHHEEKERKVELEEQMKGYLKDEYYVEGDEIA